MTSIIAIDQKIINFLVFLGLPKSISEFLWLCIPILIVVLGSTLGVLVIVWLEEKYLQLYNNGPKTPKPHWSKINHLGLKCSYISSSTECISPAIMNECSSGPKSASTKYFKGPDTIFCVSEPTRANAKQAVSGV